VPRWVVTLIYVSVPSAAFVLLVLHTLRVVKVQVDTTTLGLLGILLVVPLAPHIRRLKAGELEAEIGPMEAKQLQVAAAGLPAVNSRRTSPDESTTQEPTAYELTMSDPPLGLAQLQLELERELRRLYDRHLAGTTQPHLSPNYMAHKLREHDLLPSEIAQPLADVTALARRVMNGEYVPADIATDIAHVGERVLTALKEID
jgi:hypothetical protein